MWELAKLDERNKEMVETYLKDGFEPFAVTLDPSTAHATIWMKQWQEKPVPPPEPEPAKEETPQEVSVHEVRDRQAQPKPRTSRRASSKKKR